MRAARFGAAAGEGRRLVRRVDGARALGRPARALGQRVRAAVEASQVVTKTYSDATSCKVSHLIPI